MTKKFKFYIKKIIYNCFYLRYSFEEKILNDHSTENKSAYRFLEYNNRQTLKSMKKNYPKKVSILLPHCIQNYECSLRVTSKIENCKRCGKCKIGDILNLSESYNVKVKVATGGTLARKYLKEEKPNLIIAVACKRDLISGIYEMFPMKVYGIFNILNNGPCINTDVNILEIKRVLDIVK